ncbi:SusC/RagA family TonB-linked outer membrane protein [Chitinophaga sp. Hz27]|uniref:SusC/RagA family TonB-linked outer membrane protein n=1 Tax=Chitinophaga sp. Hz27 TaxID=3347169 RepID=UPI0035D8AAC9
MQRLLPAFVLLTFIYFKSNATDNCKSISVKEKADSVIYPKISGRIVGEDGQGLAGVGVILKGSNRGTATDSLGVFHLSNIKQNGILVLSYLGFDKKEISIVSNKYINARLVKSENRLDETVVIAYGRTTRKYNTGNIVSVNAVDIAKQPVNNPLLALQGRVPGLMITPTTGSAGSGIRVNIQGTTSLFSNLSMNDPLYVIDGIPYTSQLLPNNGEILGRSGGQFTPGESGSPLSFINPSDIERIDILKDADATAIYGSRAANGAILITTKKGKPGALKTNVNLQTGWSKMARRMKVMNTEEYLTIRNEAFANQGVKPSADPGSPQYAPDLMLWDTTRSVNWQKELLGKSQNYTKAEVSLSGGAGNTSFLASLNYNTRNSIFPSSYGGENVDRTASGHLTVSNSSKDSKFRSTIAISYLFDNNKLPQFDFTPQAILTPPNAPNFKNPDGTLSWGDINGNLTLLGYNPLLGSYSVYKVKTSNFLSSLNMDYDFARFFTFKVTMGYNVMQANDKAYLPNLPFPPFIAQYNPRSATFSSNQINNWSIEPQLKFSKNIFGGALEALLGASIQQMNKDGLKQVGNGFGSDMAMDDIAQASTVNIQSHTVSQYKYAAVFARLNYIFRDRYIFNLTGRRDGSSRFGRNNRYHSFGSAAFAWLLSDENWFKENIGVINYAKIRASYGTTGNDQIGDYTYLASYAPYGVGSLYQGIISYFTGQLSNPYLQWEETKKLSIGLEWGLLNNQLLFNLSYNRNRTTNQLTNYNLPSTAGFSGIVRNFPGLVQNSSFEGSITSVNIRQRNFRWNTSLNFTVARNKLVKFDNIENSSYANQFIVGQPITSVKVYRFAGVNPQTGLYQVYDKNGNITTNPQVQDQTQLINTAPTLFGGIQNTFTFKNFQLDFFFQYTEQTSLNNAVVGYTLPGTQINNTVAALSRWREKGDIAPVQMVTYNGVNTSDPYNWVQASNYVYRSANFLRFKNASLSYTFHFAENKGSDPKSLRAYILGQNLWTITKYTGLDPEIPNSVNAPNLLSIVFGAQLTL